MRKFLTLLLLPMLGWGQFNPVAFYEYGAPKKKYGDQFVFSTYKIVSTAVYPAQIRNSSNALLNVGFDGSGIINTATITSHASGANATISKLYDQNAKFGYCSIEGATGGTEPFCTDVSFNGLNYLRDNVEPMGLFKIGSFKLAMDKDFIVNYVFKNETQSNNNRLNFMIKTGAPGSKGLIAVCIRPSGGNYIMGVKYLYANIAVQASDVCYTFSVGDTSTTYSLFTYSYIQGVFSFYRNGTLITTTTTNESVGGLRINGIFIGTGSSDMITFATNVAASGGKKNDFKTLSLYTGKNLTSFDIATYMNAYKIIHGIP